jgi:transposase
MDMKVTATTQRIDHLGIVAGVIQDLGLIELIDERIAKDTREEISTGEAIAGMIINGLGFSDRPLTLTPQFFENKAMERFFRQGIKAEHFNRFKLGRALDDCYDDGCDQLFSELSMKICLSEGIERRFNALDTTSFALTGEYAKDSDEHTIEVVHGYSKDCRPDLKQAVLELICTHDGGVPIVSKSWNGNASDTKIFRERARALAKSFKESKEPRYLVADSKLYDQETVESCLKDIPFVTRIPATVKQEGETIKQALKHSLENWHQLDEKNHFLCFRIEHNGLNQRWLVVRSQDAGERSKKAAMKKLCHEKEDLERRLRKVEAQEFGCECDAKEALKNCLKKSKWHKLKTLRIEEVKKYLGKGRPKANSQFEIKYRIKGEIEEDREAIAETIAENSCFVIGTTVPEAELSDADVILAYKEQNNSVEKGFRFLKDPLMFASSLFVKKQSRLMGLLMIMTLALMVYAIAQRRLRRALEERNETLPNQIKKESKKPTLRWIFQLMEGIEIVEISLQDTIQIIITGINDFRKRILSYFGLAVRKIYGLEDTTALAF